MNEDDGRERHNPHEGRYDPAVWARMEAVAEQVRLLREGLTDNLRDVKQEVLRQEERFRLGVRETEQRALERTEQLSRTIVEQHATMRETLREDRQQWLSAHEHMRTDFLQLVSQLKQDNDANKKLIQMLQKYLWMFIGGLTILSILSGFLKELLAKWLK